MVPGRSDEELRCLRQSCSVLAKALSLDIKAALRLAASTAQVSAARGVLRHAQRPLSALNTFSAMLLPRLQEGAPDKDIASGLVMQVGMGVW